MKILVLASTLEVGGGEKVLSHLLGELESAGHQARLVVFKEPGVLGRELLDKGADLESWGLARTRDARILTRLVSELRCRPPALLYIQDHHDCIFWGSLAAALSGFIPTVIPVHSPGERGATSFRPLNRLLLGLGQVLVPLGRWHLRSLESEDGLAPARWVPIPNPLDENALGPASERQRGEMPVLGTVAALRPEKRHDRLLELFSQLRKRRPAELRIVGDGPERAALESLAEKLGLTGSVHFLGRQEDVGRHLEDMDLFLLTSEVEAQPLGLLEALAKGVAVAAPPLGGIPEILDGGRRGLLLEGEDPSAWARQVDTYLDRLPSREERRATAATLRKEYSSEAFRRRYLSLFRLLGDA